MDYVETAARKILAREQAIQERERLRVSGSKVVFTNGCFDILHRGHVTYLQQARGLGDALFLGLNTDDSVRRIKGEGRPIQPLEDRAAVLAGLACIDYIVPFSEDSTLPLIVTLKPDILVKGGDYRLSEVVGREEVEKWGGTVATMPLVQGQSTLHLVERIRRFGPGSGTRAVWAASEGLLADGKGKKKHETPIILS